MSLSNLAVAESRDIWSFPPDAFVPTIMSPLSRPTTATPQRQYYVEGDMASWIMPTIERLNELGKYPVNWDSYGAHRIDANAIRNMEALLRIIMRSKTPAPLIVPTSSGCLQAEWHTIDLDFEIKVLSAVQVEVFFEDRQTGSPPLDKVVDYDFSELTQAIATLTARA